MSPCLMADLYDAWPLLQRYIASARNRVYSVTAVKDADSGVLTADVSYKRDRWLASQCARHVMTRHSCSP
jgi:hypothetical protein